MIQEGDLVICTRSCCGEGVGKVFRVAAVDASAWLYHGCGYRSAGNVAAASPTGDGRDCSWFDVAWLKRIDPLGEKELREEVMELTA